MYIPQEKADSKPPACSPPVRVSSVAQISCSYGQRCPTQLPFSLWGKEDNGTPALWLRGCVSRPLHLPSDCPQVSCVSLGCVCVCVCVCVCTLSLVQLFVTQWTIAHRTPCSWDFSGKNTGVGCHFLLQGILPTRISCVSCIGGCVLYH